MAANNNNIPAAASTIILEHCEWAGHIQKYSKLRTFLIKEIHTKRCQKPVNNAKYKVPLALLEHYDCILFEKRASLSSLSVYPCEFKGQMENVLNEELAPFEYATRLFFDDGTGLTAVYYNGETKLQGEYQNRYNAAATFSPEEWSLNSTVEGSADRAILCRFKDEYAALMQTCINMVEKTFMSTETMNAHLNHYIKVTKDF